MRYAFNSWTLDVAKETLQDSASGTAHEEREVSLRPQTFRLLTHLVRRYPDVVSKDELLDDVWGAEHLSVNSLSQAISEVRQALGDSSREPRFIKTVHRRGYRFVCPVQRLDESQAAVEPPTPSLTESPLLMEPSKRPATARPTRRLRSASWSLALGAFCLLLWAMQRPIATETPSAGGESLGPAPIRLAILPPRAIAPASNEDLESNINDWMAFGLADRLARALETSAQIQVVSGDAVGRLQRELDLASADGFGPSVLQRVHQHVGCDLLLSGSFQVVPQDAAAENGNGQDGQVQMHLRLQDVHHGTDVATFQGRRRVHRWPELASELAAQLRHQLGVPEPDALQHGIASGEASMSPDAWPHYYRGLGAHFLGDSATSLEHLQRAAEVDKDAPWIAFQLSRIAHRLGHLELARGASQNAWDAAASLSESHRQRVAAHHHRVHGRTPEALTLYDDLVQRYPADSDLAQDRLRLWIDSGQGRRALEELAGDLRTGHPPVVAIRFDLLEAEAARSISSPQQHMSAARRALEHSRALALPKLMAQAQYWTADAARQQGDLQEAFLLMDQARIVAEQEGLVHLAIEAKNGLARILFRRGDTDMARQHANDALTSSRALTSPRHLVESLLTSAELEASGGNADAATDLLREALELTRQVGQDEAETRTLLQLASLLHRQGDTEAAMEHLASARQQAQSLGHRHLEAQSWNRLGSLHGSTGGFEEAEVALQRALELFQEVGDRQQAADALSNWANLHSARGSLEEAGRLYSRALELQRISGSLRGTAKILYNLGLVHLRQGRVEASRSALQESFDVFSESGEHLNACFVQRKLGDVLRQQGQLDAAQITLEKALERSRLSAHRSAEGHALFSLGELALERGDLDLARRHLERALAVRRELRQGGNIAVTQLALARLHLESHRAKQAENLVREALDTLALNSPGWQALGWSLLAQAHMAQGDVAPALDMLAKAQTLVATEENVQLKLQVELEQWRATSLAHPESPDTKALRLFAERAEDMGFISLASQARHLMG